MEVVEAHIVASLNAPLNVDVGGVLALGVSDVWIDLEHMRTKTKLGGIGMLKKSDASGAIAPVAATFEALADLADLLRWQFAAVKPFHLEQLLPLFGIQDNAFNDISVPIIQSLDLVSITDIRFTLAQRIKGESSFPFRSNDVNA